MTNEEAPKTTAPKALGSMPPMAQRQPSQLVVNIDKVDEIAEYLAAIQVPNQHRNRYDTGWPFMVVPEGLKVLDLENQMPNPRRIKREVSFTESGSFTTYINEFKVGYKPQLFSRLDDDGLAMMCIFDYDLAGIFHPGQEVTNEEGVVMKSADSITPGLPMWASHRAFMNMKYHDDYATLRKHDDKWMDQEDFAMFVEENTHLFFNPTSADMFELAQDLKIKIDANFRSSRRLANGQVALQYTEVVNGTSQASGEDVVVPSQLQFVCPLFEGLTPEKLNAAFRFKKAGNGVEFKYKLLTKLNEREAQNRMKDAVQVETGLKALNVNSFIK